MPRARQHYCWSKTEEECVMRSVDVYGRDWALIQHAYFPNLTSSQVKYKYYGVLRREVRRRSDSVTLAQFIVDDIREPKKPSSGADRVQERENNHVSSCGGGAGYGRGQKQRGEIESKLQALRDGEQSNQQSELDKDEILQQIIRFCAVCQ